MSHPKLPPGLPKPKLIPFAISGLALLNKAERWRAAWLTVLMLAAGLIELFSMTSVLPFVGVAMDPKRLETSHMVAKLHHLTGDMPTTRFMIFLGFCVMGFMAIGLLIKWIVDFILNHYVSAVQHRLARDLLHELVEAPYSWFLTQNYTVLSRIVYEDTVVWARSLVQRVLTMANDSITMILALGLVLTLSPKMGIMALVIVGGLAYLCFSVTRPILLRWAAKKRRAMDKTASAVSHAMAGIRDIKLSSRESYFTDVFSEAYEVYSVAHARQTIWHATPSTVMMMLGQMALVGIAMFFLWKGSGGAVIATQLTLLIIVTSKAVPAVNSLSASLGDLLNAYICVEGIKDLRKSVQDEHRRSHVDRFTTRPFPEKWQQLQLENVGFRYPSAMRPALQKVTLTIDHNRSYGIVGRSAAGKSTLLDILVGLLEPSEGHVLLDGTPLNTLPHRDWQKQIGYVPQSPYVVDDTLRANIAFGLPPERIDDVRVRECISLANLDSLLEHSPEGLNMPLGERGGRLSGGQRQRIAIARALYSRPTILVLDEATSALDAITESEVLEALEHLRSRITLIIIAHRLSTIQKCETIFVLEKGCLMNQGSFAELTRSDSIMKHMLAEQTLKSGVPTATEESSMP